MAVFVIITTTDDGTKNVIGPFASDAAAARFADKEKLADETEEVYVTPMFTAKAWREV